MSATLQADTFVHYYRDVSTSLADAGAAAGGAAAPVAIPIVRVEGRTFPVKDYYLEDALHWTGFEMDNATMRLVPTGRPALDFDAIMKKKVAFGPGMWSPPQPQSCA